MSNAHRSAGVSGWTKTTDVCLTHSRPRPPAPLGSTDLLGILPSYRTEAETRGLPVPSFSATYVAENCGASCLGREAPRNRRVSRVRRGEAMLGGGAGERTAAVCAPGRGQKGRYTRGRRVWGAGAPSGHSSGWDHPESPRPRPRHCNPGSRALTPGQGEGAAACGGSSTEVLSGTLPYMSRKYRKKSESGASTSVVPPLPKEVS